MPSHKKHHTGSNVRECITVTPLKFSYFNKKTTSELRANLNRKFDFKFTERILKPAEENVGK